MPSVQYDLFSQFVTNDPEKRDVSNTVEFWEAIPKYFFTKGVLSGLKDSGDFSNPYEWNFELDNAQWTVEIQPAKLKNATGKYETYYPSTTEEHVEEALKKILADQRYGLHDVDNHETWVQFTLGMVTKELRRRGRTRSKMEVKHSIAVMSRCIITLYKDGKDVWTGPILDNLVTVGYDEYLEDSDSRHVARLPLFISKAINLLEYRQFNIARYSKCNEALSRWIYKRLVHRWKQAGYTNSYHFKYSDLKASSALLQQSSEDKNRAKVLSALEELKAAEVLMNYTYKPIKKGRKIVDVVYEVNAHPEFVSDQKASNKRIADGGKIAQATTRKALPSRA